MPQQDPSPAPPDPSHPAPILEYAGPDPKPKRAAILAVSMLIVLAACGYGLWRQLDQPHQFVEPWPYYYTIDDGATVFADRRPLSTPFQKDGKDAVVAVVFTCDNAKTQFCGFLMKRAPAPANAVAGRSVTPGQTVMMNYIKKPGDTEWIPESDYDKWNAVETSVKCPEGAGEPMMVPPVSTTDVVLVKEPIRR